MLETLSTLLILILAFFSQIGTNLGLRFDKSIPPCTKPISYVIGSFDRHFNLNQKDFLAALSEAEVVWEKPTGRNLFAYDPINGSMPINLIYDYRQQVTEELGEIKGTVKEDEATYRALEAKYNILKAEHTELKSVYDQKVVEFNAHQALYEEKVANWNSGDRRDEYEFSGLEIERLTLSAEVVGLKSAESDLNVLVRDINMAVARLNQLAKTLNLNVDEYNTIGASRGDTFAGGIYTSDATGKRIDIFEFSTHEKLVRVLAHELGHALGLEHVDDPKAIMYKLNEGESATLTATDLAALNTLCATK